MELGLGLGLGLGFGFVFGLGFGGYKAATNRFGVEMAGKRGGMRRTSTAKCPTMPATTADPALQNVATEKTRASMRRGR